MLVNDDFGLLACRAETAADEIHFRLHDSQIVLRAALQHEARAQRRQVRDARNVEEDILGQHGGETGENFLRLPALALEVHDVRLHEHRASVAKHRHGLRVKSEVRKILYLQPESLGGRLQKVPVARGALRVQLEILHAAVFQDDELDVLAAHVDNHVRVVVKLQGGLGVGDRFHKAHVSL